MENPIVLSGENAIALWSRGAVEWNQWVSDNKNASVSFESIEFPARNTISFKEFTFPTGDISFNGVKFNKNSVSFEGAVFTGQNVSFLETALGKEFVSFKNTKFGNAIVDFSRAKFKGNVVFDCASFDGGECKFICTQFDHSELSFHLTNFGHGKTCFDRAKFGSGTTSFKETIFGNGRVSFERTDFLGKKDVFFGDASFGAGGVSFEHAGFESSAVFMGTKFGAGNTIFTNTIFQGQRTTFENAEFGSGVIDFDETEFGGKRTSFVGADFGECDVRFSSVLFNAQTTTFVGSKLGLGNFSFHYSRFAGKALFLGLKNTELADEFSLQGSRFDENLEIAGNFKCVPDLRGTKTSHHVDVHKVSITLNTHAMERWPHCLVAFDREDSARLQRLKEIAENNHHHDAATLFFANEMRAKRWHEGSNIRSFVDLLYDKLSDYGQSTFRPVVGLTALTAICFATYAVISALPYWSAKAYAIGFCNRLSDSISLTLGNALPFLPAARGIRADAVEKLFGRDPGLWVDFLMLGQGAFSFVFLFLIGLALRNRFRL